MVNIFESLINTFSVCLFMENNSKKYDQYSKNVNPIIYWMGLLLAIIGNMIIAVFFIPFFLVLSSLQLYIVMAIMGTLFGLMFNFLLRDIEHIDYKHHVVAGVFIPFMSLIVITVVINMTNYVASIVKTTVHQDIWMIGFIYVFSFTAPYFVYKFYDTKEEELKSKKIEEKKLEREKLEAVPKDDFSSQQEAWEVYNNRQSLKNSQEENNLKNKYNKYL